MSLGTYEPPLSALIKELDFHEPKIFLQKKTPSLLKNLYYIKRRASVMNHIFDLSGSIVKNLKGKIESTEVNQLEDQLVKVQVSARQIIDNVGNLLNVYISLSSQRTNEVVRVLTLFSVFFMPLTFIAGVYGMNFDIMPELRWTYGYLYSVLFMILVTVFIYVWFRRKGWL